MQTSADDKEFPYDSEVVSKISVEELKTIMSDSGYGDLKVIDMGKGEFAVMGQISGFQTGIFLQDDSRLITLVYVAIEHRATLERVNKFNQCGLGVTGEIDESGRAKLERRIECRFGITKRSIRKQIAFFDAEVKLFHGMACK